MTRIKYTGGKAKSKSSKSKAMERADQWFSQYIRERDTNWQGLGYCCTCGSLVEYNDNRKTCENGHFQSRSHAATRFDPRNCHAQCPKCNRFQHGEQYAHSMHIDKLYGAGIADLLAQLARTPQPQTWTEQRYREEADKWRMKVKAIRLMKARGEWTEENADDWRRNEFYHNPNGDGNEAS